MRSNEVLLSPLLLFQMDEVLTMFQFLLVPSVDLNVENGKTDNVIVK